MVRFDLHGARARRRGSALLPAVLAVMVLLGMGGVILRLSNSSQREDRAAREGLQSLYGAETGVHHAIAELTAGGTGVLGNASAPVALDGSSYYVEVTDNGDSTYTVVSRATFGTERRAVEAVVVQPASDPHPGALFAGNRSRDPGYGLELGGVAPRDDLIDGDVHSGGDVELLDDAQVLGSISATGAIVGAAGTTGVARAAPDIAGMNYPVNNDVDVAAAFGSAALQLSLSTGGLAWQLPQTDPAHVFRKNPLDRAVHTALTTKHDYFLEDPYEPLGPDPARDGSNASKITLSGVAGQPGPNGNQLVYYVDGNLWLMNLLTNSFKLDSAGAPGVQVTFVVKGNIYFGDNFFYTDSNLDGVAFVALQDSAEPDSGNIYLGDLLDGSVAPILGSLKHVDGFLYAENDVYDNNLDHLGLGSVEFDGHIAANDQILFKRDLLILRSKLVVRHDARLESGALPLPAIPTIAPLPSDWRSVSWRPIAYR